MLTKIKGIYRSVLELIIEVSKSNYPNEFVALLWQEEGIISELHFLPGTQQGEDNASIQLWMRPIDFDVVGTVHCHPGYSNRPSEADKSLFRRFGQVHIIMGMPYSMTTWRAYNMDGEPFELKVFDDD